MTRKRDMADVIEAARREILALRMRRPQRRTVPVMSWTDHFDTDNGPSDVQGMAAAFLYSDTDVPIDMRDVMYWCPTPGLCPAEHRCSCHERIAENRRRQWLRDGYRAQRQEMNR